MAKKQARGKDHGSPTGPGETLRSKGHEATIDRSIDPPVVTVDGSAHVYGTNSSGRFYLAVYAYDPAETLEELLEKYLKYLAKVDASRGEASADTLARWT